MQFARFGSAQDVTHLHSREIYRLFAFHTHLGSAAVGEHIVCIERLRHGLFVGYKHPWAAIAKRTLCSDNQPLNQEQIKRRKGAIAVGIPGNNLIRRIHLCGFQAQDKALSHKQGISG